MGGDQLPVDRVLPGLAEQRVDVLVDQLAVSAVEDQVLPVADPGQQLEPEQVRERVHRVALPLGVGVDRVRIHVRALLEQPLDDVHGLPHAARDEVREQRDVVVGDVVVGDPAVPAVADVPLGQQVVKQRVDLRPVRHDRPRVAPHLRQIQLQIGVDEVGDRAVEFLDREVADERRAELVR